MGFLAGSLLATPFPPSARGAGGTAIHVGGEAEKPCEVKLSDAASKNLTTIEGLAATTAHKLQHIVAAARSLVLGVSVPFSVRNAAAAAAPSRVTAWVTIAANQTVTIEVGSAEMGQGV